MEDYPTDFCFSGIFSLIYDTYNVLPSTDFCYMVPYYSTKEETAADEQKCRESIGDHEVLNFIV